MTESLLLKQIQVAASSLGARLFRNNVGLGWVGEVIRPAKPVTVSVTPGDILIRRARPLHAGLCEGSGDLIGFKSIQITPEMVGRTVAVFASVEVKTHHTRTTKEQFAFQNAVREAGGIGIIARTKEEALGGLGDIWI